MIISLGSSPVPAVADGGATRGERAASGDSSGATFPRKWARPSSARCTTKDSEEGGLPSCEDPSVESSSSRCDPALRDALQRLDAVRRQQPRPDDFGLERFLEDGAPSRPRQSGGTGLRTFSTALLLAAARQPGRWLPGRMDPIPAVVSRSTSPGSTLDSSTSGSLGGFSNLSGQSGGMPGGTGNGGNGRGCEAIPLPPQGVPRRRSRRAREAGPN